MGKNLVWIHFVTVLFFCFTLESSEGVYLFRDIQKPIASLEVTEKIIVLSTPRTGSTLVYMIFQYLFEDTIALRGDFNKKIVKTHDMQECDNYLTAHPNTYLVIPIRNPMESLLSKIKILSSLNLLPSTDSFILSLARSHVKEQLELLEFIQKHQSEKLLILHYENFHSDLYSILSLAETSFQIVISETEKTKILSLFSKESITELSKQFPSFAKQDPVTGLHGGHIQNDTTRLKDYISDELLKNIQDLLQPIMGLYE